MFLYNRYDNLVSDQSFDSSQINSKEYLSTLDSTTVHFTNTFPIATNDSTIISSVGTVTNDSEKVVLDLDSTVYIKLPFLNDSIKEIAYDKIDNILNKFNIFIYYFRLYSDKNNYFNLNPNEFVTYMEPKVNNTPIVDFIKVDNTDLDQYNNNNITLVYSYGNYYTSSNRIIFYSIDDNYLPLYIFECIDDTGNISYYKIFLDDEITSPNGNIFYKIEAVDLTSYSDSDLVSINKLPLLVKSVNFRKFINDNLLNYKEVNIIFKIINKDETTADLMKDVILYKENQYIKQFSSFILKFNINYSNLSNINNYSNHIYLIELQTRSINPEEADIYFNDSLLEFQKYSDKGIIYDTTNYIILNNYIYNIKFDITNTDLTVIIKNISDDVDIAIQDILVAFNRDTYEHYIQNIMKNSDNTSYYFDNNFYNMYHLISEAGQDFTTYESILDLLLSEHLFHLYDKIIGIDVNDLTSKMDVLSNIDIKSQFIQTNVNNHLFYMEFSKKDYIGYLFKFILGDYLKMISDSLMLSFYSYINGIVYKWNMKLTNDMILEKIVDEYNEIYIYLINNSGIVLSYNNILNQDRYENQFIDLYNKIFSDLVYDDFHVEH